MVATDRSERLRRLGSRERRLNRDRRQVVFSCPGVGGVKLWNVENYVMIAYLAQAPILGTRTLFLRTNYVVRADNLLPQERRIPRDGAC